MSVPEPKVVEQTTTKVDPPTTRPKDWVALVLAVGVAVAINVVCFGIMWDAVKLDAEISENGTQILTGVLGGIIGILGAYLGYSAAGKRATPGETTTTTTTDEAST